MSLAQMMRQGCSQRLHLFVLLDGQLSLEWRAIAVLLLGWHCAKQLLQLHLK